MLSEYLLQPILVLVDRKVFLFFQICASSARSDGDEIEEAALRAEEENINIVRQRRSHVTCPIMPRGGLSEQHSEP